MPKLDIQKTKDSFHTEACYWVWDVLEPSKNIGARNIVVHALTDKEGRASIESQYELAKKEGRLKIIEKK